MFKIIQEFINLEFISSRRNLERLQLLQSISPFILTNRPLDMVCLMKINKGVTITELASSVMISNLTNPSGYFYISERISFLEAIYQIITELCSNRSSGTNNLCNNLKYLLLLYIGFFSSITLIK